MNSRLTLLNIKFTAVGDWGSRDNRSELDNSCLPNELPPTLILIIAHIRRNLITF